jgi:hypothetical protein
MGDTGVTTQNEQEPEAPPQNYINRIFRFDKLEGPILSGLDAAGL